MGPKKSKKSPQKPQKRNQKAARTAVAEAEHSAIAPISFIEGLQQNNGAPLHSTALEEDLLDHTEEKQSTKRAVKTQNKENNNKPKSTLQKSKKPAPAATPVNRKAAVKRKSAGNVAVKPAKKQKVKGKTKITEPESGSSRDPESQEQSDGSVSPQNQREVFTSDEEPEGDWKPSPIKRKVKSFGPTTSRKSSSDKSRKSSSGSGNQPDNGRQRKKVKRSGVTLLDVVLEEFLDFFEQYKEPVEPNAVKKALDSFASNVEEHLKEKISYNKQLKTLTGENTKLASAIQKKRQRLLDAKNELIKSERQLWLQQKEKSELEQKLEDMNRGKTFLKNIRELNTRYLPHRQKHPNKKETYDASSFPALLIESKLAQTTEPQQQQVNDRLQKQKNKEK